MGLQLNLPAIGDVRHGLEDPVKSLKGGSLRVYQGLWYTLTSRHQLGTNIFERDWDVLLVLDACRVDALQAVAPEYDFIDEIDGIDEIWSVGSNSHEWIAQTFTSEYEAEITDTTYVTGNGFTKRIFETQTFPPSKITVPFTWTNWDVVQESQLERLIEVWKHHRDEDLKGVPPGILTDYAIDIARTQRPERLLVHYMQPHGPYLHGPVTENRDPSDIEREAWRALRDGKASFETIWDLYLDNLRLVLDDVAELLENVDADKVVITADHGEAFGEFGAYGHPEGFPHPVVKKVPWVETSATDTGTRQPDIEREAGPETDVEEYLRDLGYL
ncbi:sulfatase-like hydrolase/transferase [Natronosalvus halobius]|uniref:sulfatase-like hydrolase/transferase n=1 Tax=Natronosalvus halobius TaxID=2953746 RepID=UPI0020A00B56|nr:sulfatase-like hydrolase/transferase [Natronosalvus halobius]USZ71484.1 hypothetical protein NGM15_15670 [Natronosalvus halobius]